MNTDTVTDRPKTRTPFHRPEESTFWPNANATNHKSQTLSLYKDLEQGSGLQLPSLTNAAKSPRIFNHPRFTLPSQLSSECNPPRLDNESEPFVLRLKGGLFFLNELKRIPQETI